MFNMCQYDISHIPIIFHLVGFDSAMRLDILANGYLAYSSKKTEPRIWAILAACKSLKSAGSFLLKATSSPALSKQSYSSTKLTLLPPSPPPPCAFNNTLPGRFVRCFFVQKRFCCSLFRNRQVPILANPSGRPKPICPEQWHHLSIAPPYLAFAVAPTPPSSRFHF